MKVLRVIAIVLALSTACWAQGYNNKSGWVQGYTNKSGYNGGSGVKVVATGNVTFVSTGEPNSAGTSPLSIPAPAGIIAGNALVQIAGVYGAPPAGFVLSPGFTALNTITVGSTQTLIMGCKTATGSEPANYSITWTIGGSAAAAVIQLANTDCAHLDGSVVSSTAPGALNLTLSPITTTQPNDLILDAAAWSCGDFPAIAPGTVIAGSSNLGMIVGSYYSQASPGTSLSPIVGPMNTTNCGSHNIAGQQAAFAPIH